MWTREKSPAEAELCKKKEEAGSGDGVEAGLGDNRSGPPRIPPPSPRPEYSAEMALRTGAYPHGTEEAVVTLLSPFVTC